MITPDYTDRKARLVANFEEAGLTHDKLNSLSSLLFATDITDEELLELLEEVLELL